MGQENNKDVQPDFETPGNSFESNNSPSGAQHPGNSSEEQKLLAPPAVAPEQRQLPPPGNGAAPPPPRRRRRLWVWAAVAAVLILAALVIYHFRSIAEENSAAAKAKQQQAGAAITVGQSKTGNINIYVEALGTVTPVYTVTLYSQITGQVIGVHYTEGQLVQKGDPLIDIDPRPYQTTLTQAQGTLEHDQGLLAEAIMDLNRYKAAIERNAIARQQYEDQEQIVVQDRGTVKADQGTVAYDEVQLSYCHIVSPITGRVGLRLVDPGNTVFAGSGSTLVVITQLQPITVVFNVSEDDLPQVQAQLHGGRSLEVDAFDRADEKQIEAGKLTSLDNEVDTTTGTVKFRATFPNKNLTFYPNQFVNARLLVKTLRKVTLVPSAAVQHNGTNAFVYIVNSDNTVTVQQITALTSNDQDTAVQGLNAGVNVATSGFDRLENGVEVAVRGQPPQQNNPGHGSTSGTGGTTAANSNSAP
jgi:multidrug efflux system membrane fusion protein